MRCSIIAVYLRINRYVTLRPVAYRLCEIHDLVPTPCVFMFVTILELPRSTMFDYMNDFINAVIMCVDVLLFFSGLQQ